ncbi:DUF4062 domain-containing protein [Aphelenchoides bicaudatus]|nr:DUF4062 domain-containing protein [Aphelenchoides bicaudatus]
MAKNFVFGDKSRCTVLNKHVIYYLDCHEATVQSSIFCEKRWQSTKFVVDQPLQSSFTDLSKFVNGNGKMTATVEEKIADESSPPLIEKPPLPKKKRKRNAPQPARPKNGDLPTKQSKNGHSRSQSLNKKHPKKGSSTNDLNKLDQPAKSKSTEELPKSDAPTQNEPDNPEVNATTQKELPKTTGHVKYLTSKKTSVDSANQKLKTNSSVKTKKSAKPKQLGIGLHSTSLVNLPTHTDEISQDNSSESNPIHKSASTSKIQRDQSLSETDPLQTLNATKNAPKKPKEVDKRVQDIFNRVFSGHFSDIPPPLSKLVRVFTSSTFTDTTVERNALMEDVYPALKRYCRETHGLDFQVVDMRWGVRDEATDDHI